MIWQGKTAQGEAHSRVPLLHDPHKRALLFQLLVLAGVGMLAYYLITNTITNLQRQSIATGFGFLKKEASFEIGESFLLSYSAADNYAKALLVGVLNTLLVSSIGIVLTTVLGTLIGIARLSSNYLLAKLSAAYTEIFQNIPILLQLFFWYAFFYEMLPHPREAINPIKGVFLSNRGLVLAVPQSHPAYSYMAVALVAAIGIVSVLRTWASKRQARTGRTFPVFRVSLGIITGLPALVWLASGSPTAMNMPVLQAFNFHGGMTISPEFAALLLGLVLYTAAFVAEVVRAGIQSVSSGQKEAALSIGLKPVQVLQLVILPQALRVIVPPLTSQMLNLTKNSSLAVAIGYPDFVSVCGTTINQTGQAIEGVVLIMAVYLIFSLATSAFMNWYNKKIRLVER